MTNYYNSTLETRFLTFPQKYAIYLGLQRKDSITTIAKELGFSRQTIHSEIKRGTVEHLNPDLSTSLVYDIYASEYKHEEAIKWKGRLTKISEMPYLKEFIEKKLNDHYSPEVIEFFLKEEMEKENHKIEGTLSSVSIYYNLDKGNFNVGNEKLYYGKRKSNKPHKKEKLKIKPNGGESIELREKIDDRLEFGHWEIDCVVGKREGKSTSFMTLVERKTRFGITILIPKKNKKSIVNALKRIKSIFGKYFYDIFKSITADNGSEFKDAIGMSLKVRGGKKVKIYFAHAYSSWERGTNENYNRFIRRYFPKGTDLKKVTPKELLDRIRFINNYPRKQFNFQSSNQLFINEIKRIIDLDSKIEYIKDRL